MFIDKFIRYLEFEKRFSQHTVSNYSHDLGQFLLFLDLPENELAGVVYHDIRNWMLHLMEGGAEAKTVSRKLSVLRSFYKFLQRESLIEMNPMMLVRAPRVPKRLPVVVDEQRLNVLLDSEDFFSNDFPGLRNRVVVELLYGTGIRLAELIGMKDHDIDLYARSVKVFGKRRKERIIPFTAALADLLEKYLEQKKQQNFDNKTNALIVTDRGAIAYPGLIYRIVKASLHKISTQEKRSPHVLRHSFATALLNKGADLNAIKELLGHAGLAATQVYTHNSIEKLKAVYKQAHPKA